MREGVRDPVRDRNPAGPSDDGGNRRRAPSLRSIAALGFGATLLVVVGGALAGAAAPGDAWRLWSVPAIPVTPSVDLVPALVAYYGGLIVLVRRGCSCDATI